MVSENKSTKDGLLRWVVFGLLATAALLVLVTYVLLVLNTRTLTAWLGRKSDGTLLSAAEWYDIARAAVTLTAAFAVGATLVLAYRRQRTNDLVERTQRGQLALDETKESSRVSELEGQTKRDQVAALKSQFATAASQLGHEQPATRLAGIYALASVADEWAAASNWAEQKVCIDVLCAYLRLPYDPASARARNGDREVRWAVIKVIRDHLVDSGATSWVGRSLDFTGAVFDGGSFEGAHFKADISFREARFVSGEFRFNGARFAGGKVHFSGAAFSGAAVLFWGSEFSGGTLNFNGCKFSSGVLDFVTARFTGADVQFQANLEGTRFKMWSTFAGGALRFTGSIIDGSEIDFTKAKMLGGKIVFHEPRLKSGLLTLGPEGVPRPGLMFVRPRSTPGLAHFDEREVVFSEDFPNQSS